MKSFLKYSLFVIDVETLCVGLPPAGWEISGDLVEVELGEDKF